MKNKMKLIFPAALAAIIFGTGGVFADTKPADTNAPAAATMTSLFGDPVIAKGKGVEVKQSALDEVVVGLKSAYAARGQTIPPQQLMGIEAKMLDRLVQIQLLLQKATDADKADGKAKAELQISNVLARAGTQEAFERELKSVGMTPEELRLKITQEATATAALTRLLGAAVTDADATNFYTAHPTDFEQPEMVRAAHILLGIHDPATGADLTEEQKAAKRKQIEELLKRARNGEDFSLLAKQYSEDPGSKDKGGEYTFPKGQMVPEFEAAAFSLQTNQISDVVTTQFGYHIIKLYEKIPAQTIAYAKVADKIKDYLVSQKTEKLATPYLDGLEKAAGVEILDPDLKAAAAALAAATNAPPATMP